MQKQNCMFSFLGSLQKDMEPFAGGKGRTLARLYQAGYSVPNGFIVMPQAFIGDELRGEAWMQIRAGLAILRKHLKGASFAVRSSALSEDSAQASFAGEFDTVLDVCTEDDIRKAVITVRLSRHNARVQAYMNAQGMNHKEQEIAVIIQRLIRADISGVLFTVDPVADSLAHGGKLYGWNGRKARLRANEPAGVYS